MRSHFVPSNLNTEQRTPPAGKRAMRSHFLMSSAAMACALSAATAMMPGVCSGQIAADYATNATYSGGWSAGQNGGFGFGAWSFNHTDPTPPGQYQAISSSSVIGTAWTLMTHSNTTGLANAGRAILAGGLQIGQTFETVIDNPTTSHFFRGFDILFTSGPDNNGGGTNTSALRASVFNYGSTTWKINDGDNTSSALSSGINQATVAAAGMQLDLTLTSASTYHLTMTPLNGATPFTHDGNLVGTNLPIDWVDFRFYHGTNTGVEDPTDNFEISYETITVPEPSTLALIGLGSAGLLFLRRRK